MKKKAFFFLLSFLSACTGFTKNISITDVRVGAAGNKTRLSFVLTAPANLYTILNDDQLTVEAPEDSIWAIPETVRNAQGAFQHYQLSPLTKTPRSIRVALSPFTRIAHYGLSSSNGEHFFNVDLITEEPPPPEPEPEPEIDTQEEAKPTQTVVVNPVIEKPTPPKNTLKAVQVSEKSDGTTLVSITSSFSEFFRFENIPDEKKILIYLPKTNWLTVDTRLKSSSIIRTYRVQDTDPSFSVITLECYKPCGVIDQFMSPNSDGSNDFVLVIAGREANCDEKIRLAEKVKKGLKDNIYYQKQMIDEATKKAALQAADQSLDTPTQAKETPPSQEEKTSNKAADTSLFDTPPISTLDAPKDFSSNMNQEPDWVKTARQKTDSEEALVPR